MGLKLNQSLVGHPYNPYITFTVALLGGRTRKLLIDFHSGNLHSHQQSVRGPFLCIFSTICYFFLVTDCHSDEGKKGSQCSFDLYLSDGSWISCFSCCFNQRPSKKQFRGERSYPDLRLKSIVSSSRGDVTVGRRLAAHTVSAVRQHN